MSSDRMRDGRVSSGSYDFNRWLYGGYEKDIITMIAGPPGSGKTNFCILVSASQAKKGNKVLFIDTEGGFSVDRLKQIIESNKEDQEKILGNILIMSPVNFQEQKEIFPKILDKIKKDGISLIIVDGMAMLYRLELGDAIQSGEDENIKRVNREMAKQMRILAEIARNKNIPVIITNQVYSKFQSMDDENSSNQQEREVNLVGGDLFKYWSKCIIELKHDGGRRRAILLKHRSLPNKSLSFDIKEKGIFKRGWI